MSRSQPVSEGENPSYLPAQPANPLKNPSYPSRTHAAERPRWLEVVAGCEARLATAGQQLDSLAPGAPARLKFDRLFTQMRGACDQVSDAAKRLPGETGDLYDEDKHRLEEALAALDRLQKQWEAPV